MSEADEMDWEQYQQNQIDEAKEAIEDRRDHLGDYRQLGLLDGEYVNHRDNTQLKAYLQGYADALEFAAERVELIDNLVPHVEKRLEDTQENEDTAEAENHA